MEFNMELVATIAVVGSVLVFAYQARELARQSRVGNDVAGTKAHRELMVHLKGVLDVFIQYPELHAHYYDQSPNPPSATDSVRLKVIAEQHGDWLDSCLVTTRQLRSYEWVSQYGGWDDYIRSTVESSSTLRSAIGRGDWPSLDPYVARYDAEQAGLAAPS